MSTLTNYPYDLIIHQYNTSADGLTIASVIANGNSGASASALTKSGSGVLKLTATNTYTGPTYLNGGTTVISSNANLGSQTTGATLYLNNGTLQATADVGLHNGAAGTNDRAVVLNGVGGTFSVDPGKTLTIHGSITGPGGLTKTGDGTLVLNNAATNNTCYTGPATVSAGTLKFGVANVNNIYSAFNVTGGTLDMGGYTNYIGSLEGSGTVITSVVSYPNLYIGSLPSDTTFSGKITGGINVEKMGAGTLTLTGANDYYSATTISGGGLALAGGGSLPNTSGVSITSATGKLDISGLTAAGTTLKALSAVSGSSVVLGSKKLTVGDATTTLTIAGVISGSGGSLTKVGTGTLILTGVNTYTGDTMVNNGVLSITNACLSDTGTVSILAGKVLDLNFTGNDTIQALSLAGASMAAGDYYAGMPTYGAYFTSTGHLLVSGSYWAPWSAGGQGTAADHWSESALKWAATTTIPGAGPQASGLTLVFTDVAGDVAVDGTVTVNAGLTFLADNYKLIDGSSSPQINLNGASLALNTITVDSGETAKINVKLIGSNGLTKAGDGTLSLGGANTYTGVTSVEHGTLEIAAGSIASQTVNVKNDAKLSGVGTLTQADVSYTSSAASEFDGAIQGTGKTLTVDTAAGSLTLGGHNTYGGGTFVTTGTLIVTSADGLPPSGGLTIAAGGTVVLSSGLSTGAAGAAAAHVSPAAVPEPGTIALLAAGVAGLLVWRRRR